MAWNPNNPSQNLAQQAQQQAQQAQRQNQQFIQQQQNWIKQTQAHNAWVGELGRRQQQLDDDETGPLPMYQEDWPGGTVSAGATRIGQFLVLIGAVVFTASVTVLTGYDVRAGGKSLWQATHGDLASPLYPKDFWILIGLVALAFVATSMSLRTYRRPFMIGAAAASAGLIAYTLHIPQTGHYPGFGPYGSAYWISLIAAIAMALGAGVAAVTRSAP